ncbi:MAG: hypothetical protein P3W96_006375 [Halomonas sp.]|nr:hypothetical protein [Halomonas sp.]MDM7481628.1 hypothetical protein [Halomonas sp.]
MTPLENLPGWWHYRQKISFGGVLREIDFFHNGSLVGQAKLVVFHTAKERDPLWALCEHGDIACVMDEVDTYLRDHPGGYVWLDRVQRLSEHHPVKGNITRALREVLEPVTLGVPAHYRGLLFPCPYGSGDIPESEQRQRLRQWYEKALGAKALDGVSLMEFALPPASMLADSKASYPSQRLDQAAVH